MVYSWFAFKTKSSKPVQKSELIQVEWMINKDRGMPKITLVEVKNNFLLKEKKKNMSNREIIENMTSNKLEWKLNAADQSNLLRIYYWP